ncbi:hypothetical protein EON66_08970 [archaeon]|nr:MAG: hypothetical protein EON66_08970 [archaeon]
MCERCTLAETHKIYLILPPFRMTEEYHLDSACTRSALLDAPMHHKRLKARLSFVGSDEEVRVMWKAWDDGPTDAEAAGTPLVNPKQPLLSQVHVLGGHAGAGGGHKLAASAVPPGGHNYVHIRGTHPLPASVSGT